MNLTRRVACRLSWSIDVCNMLPSIRAFRNLHSVHPLFGAISCPHVVFANIYLMLLPRNRKGTTNRLPKDSLPNNARHAPRNPLPLPSETHNGQSGRGNSRGTFKLIFVFNFIFQILSVTSSNAVPMLYATQKKNWTYIRSLLFFTAPPAVSPARARSRERSSRSSWPA